MKLSSLAAGVALSALMVTGAVAADIFKGDASLKDDTNYASGAVHSWQGPYVGVGVGYSWTKWEDDTKCEVLKEDADGWLVTGRVGYDWQRGRVVGGVFGDISWLDSHTDKFADAELSGRIGARLGYLLNGRLLGYVNGGLEITDFDGDVDTGVDPFLGGGLELLLGDGWSLAAEGALTFVSDDEAGIEQDNLATARLMLLKKF